VNQPLLPHQLVLTIILVRLRAWTEAAPGRGLACLSVDLRLGPADVYAPDLWWVREERRPPPGAATLDGLPDLVVEVRAPSTWRYDTGRKRRKYEEGGVAELWLVDTVARVVVVHRRSAPDQPNFEEPVTISVGETLLSPLLPGFALPVADVFAGV